MLNEYRRQFDNANVYYEFVCSKNVNKVAVSDILYVNSDARKLIIHTGGGIFETYEKLDDFLAQPVGKNFICIHKSFL